MRDALEQGYRTFTKNTNLAASPLRIEQAGPSVSILIVVASRHEYGKESGRKYKCANARFIQATSISRKRKVIDRRVTCIGKRPDRSRTAAQALYSHTSTSKTRQSQ
jgi:hypothetical protein